MTKKELKDYEFDSRHNNEHTMRIMTYIIKEHKELINYKILDSFFKNSFKARGHSNRKLLFFIFDFIFNNENVKEEFILFLENEINSLDSNLKKMRSSYEFNNFIHVFSIVEYFEFLSIYLKEEDLKNFNYLGRLLFPINLTSDECDFYLNILSKKENYEFLLTRSSFFIFCFCNKEIFDNYLNKKTLKDNVNYRYYAYEAMEKMLFNKYCGYYMVKTCLENCKLKNNTKKDIIEKLIIKYIEFNLDNKDILNYLINESNRLKNEIFYKRLFVASLSSNNISMFKKLVEEQYDVVKNFKISKNKNKIFNKILKERK